MPAMSTLKARLESDLRESMKARDELVTSTLRMALAAVRTARHEGDRLMLLDETGHVRLVLAPAKTAAADTTARRAHVYRCPEGPALAVTYVGEDAVDAWLPDGRRRLPRVPAASGARYADDQVTVWNKGTDVLLERDGRSWLCVETDARSPR